MIKKDSGYKNSTGTTRFACVQFGSSGFNIHREMFLYNKIWRILRCTTVSWAIFKLLRGP